MPKDHQTIYIFGVTPTVLVGPIDFRGSLGGYNPVSGCGVRIPDIKKVVMAAITRVKTNRVFFMEPIGIYSSKIDILTLIQKNEYGAKIWRGLQGRWRMNGYMRNR